MTAGRNGGAQVDLSGPRKSCQDPAPARHFEERACQADRDGLCEVDLLERAVVGDLPEGTFGTG
ncbi:hypothetical protein ACH41H_37860 [Streptomyces sp. NPDC020800]|uniref:hypothetical protein n=1 Tax=Streptomyces sp. NPDC020800 TaxID=3365092 RepID=UPI0037A828E6